MLGPGMWSSTFEYGTVQEEKRVKERGRRRNGLVRTRGSCGQQQSLQMGVGSVGVREPGQGGCSSQAGKS